MRSFIVMTALPPTKGHQSLIDFASELTEEVEVILCTQPEEPYWRERVSSLRQMYANSNVNVNHLHKTLPQNPSESENFWEMWKEILEAFSITAQDVIVASENYGAKLAEITGCKFFPYDINREILNVKATPIRNNVREHFEEVMETFQPHLRMTVTVFGAESTGKTTLSKALAKEINAHWLFEYARPYLEATDPKVTEESMHAIWGGQKALQQQGLKKRNRPFLIQDTDLFSTVGYWDFWNMGTPANLVNDALRLKSELYLITQSNIPFEADPLRYGVNQRECSDQYWINLCQRHNLNYVILKESSPINRLREAKNILEGKFDSSRNFAYQRRT